MNRASSALSLLLSPLILVLSSCSDTKATTQPARETLTFSGIEFVVLSGKPEVTREKMLTGKVKLMARKPFDGDRAHFHLKADLSEPGAHSLRFFSYADLNLDSGLDVYLDTLPTAADASDALKGYFAEKGKVAPLDLQGQGIVNGHLDAGVEIHADHGHGHLILNGEEVADLGFAARKDSPRFWGLELDGVKLESIEASPSQDHDD